MLPSPTSKPPKVTQLASPNGVYDDPQLKEGDSVFIHWSCVVETPNNSNSSNNNETITNTQRKELFSNHCKPKKRIKISINRNEKGWFATKMIL